MNLAAVDIGSNAIRLLFNNVVENGDEPVFNKETLIRAPIRLGEDVFSGGHISDDKIDKLVKTMLAFKELLGVYEVVDYRACATSAMRESSNGQQVIDHIKEKTGIEIEIIDGHKEGLMIVANHIERLMTQDKQNFLYIDVGGGSTELVMFSKDRIIGQESFKLGTIRLLKKAEDETEWKRMKSWIRDIADLAGPIYGIGSGGNINKIIKLNNGVSKKSIELLDIVSVKKNLESYTYEERILQLGLKRDRADVIIPAACIFIKVMKWSGIEKLYVPKIGLSDGIIKDLYQTLRKG